MSDSYHSKFLDEPEFKSLLVRCLESVQNGETIDRDALKVQFPKYADEIAGFLDDRNVLEQVAAQIEEFSSSKFAISPFEKTLPGAAQRDYELHETIRYIGEYEILEEIARGGMGIVFKAKQQNLNRIVALKMILSGKLADDIDVERFRREAKAAGGLKHSNIVPVHEIGEFEGRHYFTMDFVEGRSLAEMIREESLPPRQAAKLVQSTAEAVQYAHARGVIHRDLKPANILVDSGGEPQITDFGLAKVHDAVADESRSDLTATGQILGTPSYMSPEQASGSQTLVGPASDIYSLGAILYAALTGRAPFVADSPVDTLLQVVNQDPVPPRVLNNAIPHDLETICLKCLSKERKKRYASAQELADDLECFLDGKPIAARPVGRVERTWRWATRNPVIATLLTLFIISLIAGTGISAYFAIEARDRANDERIAKERAQELQEQTEQLAEELQVSLDLESKLRDDAQRERQVAQLAQQEEEAQKRLAEEHARVAKQREKKALWHLYVSQLYPLMDLWRQGDFGQLDRLLDESIPSEGEPDFRHWEWYYLRDQTRFFFEQLPAAVEANVVAYHHKDKRLAVLYQNRLEIWNPWNNDLEKTFVVAGRIHQRHAIDWSPDGTQVAFLAPGEKVNVYDIAAGESLFQISTNPKHNSKLRSFDWSPDGKRIATGTWFGNVKIWDATTGELESTLVEQEGQSNLGCVRWHHDSNRIALALRYGWTHVYDVDSKKMLWAKKAPNNTGGISLSWSPDGKMLAVGNGGVALYSADGEKIHYFACHRGSSRDIVWTDNEQFLTGGSDQDVVVINVPKQQEIQRLVHNSSGVNAVIWDDAQQRIVTASDEGRIKLARLETSRQDFEVLEHERANQKNRRLLHRVSFSPDGELLVGVVDHVAMVWDARTKKVVGRFEGDKPVWYANWIHNLSWRPDSQIVVGTCKAAQPVIWKRPTEETVYARDNSEFQPWSVDWSPDGKFILLGGDNRSQIWSGENFDVLKEFDAAGRVNWAIDGKIIYIGTSTVDAKQLKTISTGRPEMGRLSPDQKFSATINQSAGWETVRITETVSGQTLVILRGHNAEVTDVAWSPDGKRLGTSSADGTIKIWDTATGDLLITLPHPDGEEYRSLVWSPDGRTLAAGTGQGRIHLYGGQSMDAIPEIDYLESGVLASVKTPEEVLSELRTVVQNDPRNSDAWVKLIIHLQKMQRLPEAIAAIEHYLEELVPGDSWRPSRALMVALAIGDEAAIQKFVPKCQVIAANSDIKDATRSMAVQALCLRDGLIDRPNEYLDVTKRYADSSSGWYQNSPYALCLLRAGQFDELTNLLETYAGEVSVVKRIIISLIKVQMAIENEDFNSATEQFAEIEPDYRLLPTGYVELSAEPINAQALFRDTKRRIEVITQQDEQK